MSRLVCPTCKRVLPDDDTGGTARSTRPFCSPRCKMADLGSWLNQSYRIAAPLADVDLDEGLPTEGDSHDPN